MYSIFRLVILGLLLVWSAPAYADCKDEIEDVRKEISGDKDKYSKQAKARARKKLAEATTNRHRPAECRKNVLQARRELKK